MIVHTETGSIYDFDLDARTVTRCHVGDESVELRRDGDPVPLLRMAGFPETGKPLVMILDIRGDGIETVRTTSPVVAVQHKQQAGRP